MGGIALLINPQLSTLIMPLHLVPGADNGLPWANPCAVSAFSSTLTRFMDHRRLSQNAGFESVVYGFEGGFRGCFSETDARASRPKGADRREAVRSTERSASP